MVRREDGTIASSIDDILEVWEKYFRDFFKENINQTQGEADNRNTDDPENDTPDPTTEEVANAISKLKNHKAPGPDGIPTEILKNGGDKLSYVLHSLIVKLWRIRQMPEEWLLGTIVPVHKKGELMSCKNYRPISLLNTAYKVLSHILLNRLKPHVEDKVGDYQAGFRTNRSTTDQIFIMRQILEKCWEESIDIHLLFVDYRNAYDLLNKRELWNKMIEMGFPKKLIELCRMTTEGCRTQVRVRGCNSTNFPQESGLRQGDAISPILFNIALEAIMRETQLNVTNSIFTRNIQILAFADDIVIIGRKAQDVKEAFSKIVASSAKFNLRVNDTKTKYMIVSKRGQRLGRSISLDDHSVEIVDNFIYLGTMLTAENKIKDDIRRRIVAANKTYFALVPVLKNKEISRQCKVRLYKTLIRPVLCYGSEAWTLTQQTENQLKIFERKILRRIFGPVRVNQNEWRIRTNEEVQEMYDEINIATYVKLNRLRWLGHVVRASEDRVLARIFNGRPSGRRRVGRPRNRWMDDVLEDVRKLRITNWRELARRRDDWKRRLREARVLQGL